MIIIYLYEYYYYNMVESGAVLIAWKIINNLTRDCSSPDLFEIIWQADRPP